MSKKEGHGKKLGATHPVGVSQVVFFLPDRDQFGDSIGQEFWCEQALRIFGRLFRGATAFPPGRGVWRNDQEGGNLLLEITVMIISYVEPSAFDKNTWRELRDFLHRFGREANQGEVGIVIDNQYYGISVYDIP